MNTRNDPDGEDNQRMTADNNRYIGALKLQAMLENGKADKDEGETQEP